jgi:hypothetical protein
MEGTKKLQPAATGINDKTFTSTGLQEKMLFYF